MRCRGNASTLRRSLGRAIGTTAGDLPTSTCRAEGSLFAASSALIMSSTAVLICSLTNSGSSRLTSSVARCAGARSSVAFLTLGGTAACGGSSAGSCPAMLSVRAGEAGNSPGGAGNGKRIEYAPSTRRPRRVRYRFTRAGIWSRQRSSGFWLRAPPENSESECSAFVMSWRDYSLRCAKSASQRSERNGSTLPKHVSSRAGCSVWRNRRKPGGFQGAPRARAKPA